MEDQKQLVSNCGGAEELRLMDQPDGVHEVKPTRNVLSTFSPPPDVTASSSSDWLKPALRQLCVIRHIWESGSHDTLWAHMHTHRYMHSERAVHL
ncbi:uncharacterized protein V6R79_016882 [Siganus canaliculatus]